MRCYAMFLTLLFLSLSTGGCATTFVPISWGMGEKVQRLSRSDQTLAIFYNRYDPQRQTLRVAGASFDEVMMPSEVKLHLGAYRADTKLIYRNLYYEYSDPDLRNVMLHEMAHHIWFGFMDAKQRKEWVEHLDYNPTPLRALVRRTYQKPADYETEDFAFTVEYARAVDIRQLARMNLISAEERETILTQQNPALHAGTTHGSARFSSLNPELSSAEH